jgi:hypothetical protein
MPAVRWDTKSAHQSSIHTEVSAPAPRLPEELLDLVVDALDPDSRHDMPTLIALSLVCRPTLRRSRWRMFSTLEFDRDDQRFDEWLSLLDDGGKNGCYTAWAWSCIRWKAATGEARVKLKRPHTLKWSSFEDAVERIHLKHLFLATPPHRYKHRNWKSFIDVIPSLLPNVKSIWLTDICWGTVPRPLRYLVFAFLGREGSAVEELKLCRVEFCSGECCEHGPEFDEFLEGVSRKESKLVFEDLTFDGSSSSSPPYSLYRGVPAWKLESGAAG